MVYWDIIKFSFLRFFSYPFEILAQTFKRAIEVGFLILFWSIIARTSKDQISVPQISAYFLIALAVADLTMSRWGHLSGLIGNQVKSGQISNLMIKPANLMWSIYAMSLGRVGLRMLLAVISLVVGVIVYPPQGWLPILMFLVFFILSWSISFAYNIFEGSLYFYFADASGIRNSLQNMIRIFTGAMIPIYMFPSPLKEMVAYTPFPSMVYGPTTALTITTFDGEVLRNLLVAIFWAVFMNISMRWWWARAMKKYEAVGI